MNKSISALDLSLEDLTNRYIKTGSLGLYDLPQMQEAEGEITKALGSPQAVEAYRKAKAQDEARMTYPEYREEYLRLVAESPEAVKARQEERLKPLALAERTIAGALMGPGASIAMTVMDPNVYEILGFPDAADWLRQIQKFVTPVTASGAIETALEKNGPIKSPELALGLEFLTGIPRGALGTPSGLLLDLPQSIAGRTSGVGQTIERAKRITGMSPSATEIAVGQAIPPLEIASQLGATTGEIGFALGVQMPLLRQIPGLGKIAKPIEKLLGRVGIPWIQANAPRIATNMVLRSAANMSRRMAQEGHLVVGGELPIGKALLGWGLTGAFSALETLPEVIPNPAVNIFTQTVQGSLDNAVQDVLEGREVTEMSIIQGALFNFFYGLDDASRVRNFAKVQTDINPLLKGISPDVSDLNTRSRKITEIVANHIDRGTISPADAPTILSWAGAEGALRVMNNPVARAVSGGNLAEPTRAPKATSGYLGNARKILNMDEQKFKMFQDEQDYKGTPYGLVLKNLAANKVDPKLIATYVEHSEALKARNANQALIDDSNIPTAKDLQTLRSGEDQLAATFNRNKGNIRQIIEIDVPLGKLNDALGQDRVNKEVLQPISAALYKQFGENAVRQFGGRFDIIVTRDMDGEEVDNRVNSLLEQIKTLKPGGVEVEAQRLDASEKFPRIMQGVTYGRVANTAIRNEGAERTRTPENIQPLQEPGASAEGVRGAGYADERGGGGLGTEARVGQHGGVREGVQPEVRGRAGQEQAYRKPRLKLEKQLPAQELTVQGTPVKQKQIRVLDYRYGDPRKLFLKFNIEANDKAVKELASQSDAVIAADLNRFKKALSGLSWEQGNRYVVAPILRSAEALFGRYACAPQGDEFTFIKPPNWSMERFVDSYQKFADFVEGLSIDGKKLGITGSLSKTLDGAWERLRIAKPKNAEGERATRLIDSENLMPRKLIVQPKPEQPTAATTKPKEAMTPHKPEDVKAVKMPITDLPEPQPKVTQKQVDRIVGRFRQMGEEKTLKAIDDRAEVVAIAAHLQTNKIRQIRDMTVAEVGKTVIRKLRGGWYQLKYSQEEILAIADAVAKRDVGLVKQTMRENSDKFTERIAQGMEQKGRRISAFLVRERIRLTPWFAPDGRPMITEDYLAIPARFRAEPYNKMSDKTLKRDNNNNYVIPQKFWAKPGTQSNLDEVATTLASGEYMGGYQIGLLREPRGDVLIEALKNEWRPRIDKEAMYYANLEEEFRSQHAKELTELDKLLENKDYEGALKLIAKAGVSEDLRDLLMRRMTGETKEEDPFEEFAGAKQVYFFARQASTRRPPRVDELKVEGTGDAEKTEKARAMEAKGQLRLGEGAQPKLLKSSPAAKKAPPFDAVVWVRKVEEYINAGVPRLDAAKRAMEDALAAKYTRIVAKQLHDAEQIFREWPDEKTQTKVQRILDLLGVPKGKEAAFLAHNSTILKGLADRIKDPSRIAKELQRMEVNVNPEMPRIGRSEALEPDPARSASMRMNVEREAVAAATTEASKLDSESSSLLIRQMTPVSKDMVYSDASRDKLQEVLNQRVEEMLVRNLPEDVLKGRLRVEQAMDALRRKGGRRSVAVINIGRLAEINSKAGYVQGDAFIKEVTDKFGKLLPKGSVVGRYGPRGGEFVAVLPHGEAVSHASLASAIDKVQKEAASPDGKPIELYVGLAENANESTVETIAEATEYTNGARKLGVQGLIIRKDLYDRYRAKLEKPEVVYRPEAVGQTLDVQAKINVDGYVEIPELEVRTPADVAAIGRQLTNPAQEKLVIVSVSDDNIIEGVSVAALGDQSSIPFNRYQKTLSLAPHLLQGGEGTSVYIVHNHPGGDPTPTRADIEQYNFIRSMAEGLGLKFKGGISIGADQYAFVRPSGVSFDVETEDMPAFTAKYRSPVISAGIETGKAPPVTADDMPGFLARSLVSQDSPDAVYAVPFGPDGKPRGVFQVAFDLSEPHHVATELAKLSASTLADRMVIATGSDPNAWQGNLSIIHHDLSSMFGVELVDAVGLKGESFRDFEGALPDIVKLKESAADATWLKEPVRRYRLPVDEEPALKKDPKAQGARPLADMILHFVTNPEEILQRGWTNFIDKKGAVTYLNQKFQQALSHIPGGKAVLRAFSTSFGRPEDYLTGKEELTKGIGRWGDIAVEVSGMLHRGWKPEQRKLLLAALQGKVKLNEADNPKLYMAYIRARNLLIEAGDLAVKVSQETGVPLLSQETFLKNFGTYVPRLYMFFENNGWRPDEWRRAYARKWLMENGLEVRNVGGKLEPVRGMTEDEANHAIASILAGKPISIYVMGQKGPREFSLSLSRFKQRKNVPHPIRVLLGEIEEPSYLVGKGVMDIARDALTAQFFSRIAANPKAAISAEEWELLPPKEQAKYARLPKGGTLHEAAPKEKMPFTGKLIGVKDFQEVVYGDADKAGPLGGMYVLKPIYDDIMGMVAWQSDASKTVKRLMGLYKSFKVTANPSSVCRNMMSNFMFAEMFGDLPMLRLDVYARAAKKMIAGVRGKDDFYQQVKNEGLFRTTFSKEELLGFLEEIKGARNIGDIKRRGTQWIAKIPFKLAEKTADLYGVTENYFKFSTALYQADHFRKSVPEAVRIAQKSLFDYSDVTFWIRKARSSWWGQPFITFQTKWVPQFTRALIRKPLTVLKWLALPLIVSQISRRQLGLSEDEYRKLRKQLPEWMRDNPTITLYWQKDKYGRYQWIDGTYIFPWGQLMQNKGLGALNWGLQSLVGGSPWFSMVNMAVKFENALATGEPPIDDYMGRQIWKPTDPPEQQFLKAVEYVNQKLGPTWLPGGPTWDKIVKTVGGQPDFWGRQWTPQQLALYNFGVKVTPIDNEEATRQKIYDYYTELNTREVELRRLEQQFYRMTGKNIRWFPTDDLSTLPGAARAVAKKYLRTSQMLNNTVDEAAAEYQLDPGLTFNDAMRLGDERLKLTDVQLRSYSLRSRLREELEKLEQTLEERYPSGIPTIREELAK